MLPSQNTQQTEGRVGNYQHTAPYGRKYYPFDPRPEEVYAEFIAHHLATCCRYNGAVQHPVDPTKIFYSVAEHSVYCSYYVEYHLQRPDLALEALWHDASEAPIGDLIRPLKYSPEFRRPFHDVEKLNEEVIAEALNLVYPWPAEIKIADEAVCTAEINQIVPRAEDDEWESGKMHDDSIVAPYTIQMMEPWRAKEFFLDRHAELSKTRSKFRELPSRFVL